MRGSSSMERSRVARIEKWRTPKAVDQARKTPVIRKFGVPPPKCSCTTSRSRSNSGATMSALAHQAFGIRRAAAHVARDDSIASAVEARRETEWHVHVQRQVARNRLLVAARHLPPEVGIGEARGKLRRRRIRGVTRTGPVVAAQQIEIEFQAMCSWASPGLPSARGLHRMGAYTTTKMPKLRHPREPGQRHRQ